MTDEVMRRAVEAGARAADKFDCGGWSDTPREYQEYYLAISEAAIRAALPIVAEELAGALMKRAWEFGGDAATTDAMVRALRARLAEIMGGE